MDIRCVLRDAATGCELRFSHVKAVRATLRYAPLSIKHVEQGEEVYAVEGRIRKVRTGEHLVVQDGGAGEVAVHPDEPARGICIDIGTPVLDMVAADYAAEDDRIASRLLQEDFFDGQRAPQGKRTAALLEQVAMGACTMDRALFLGVAEAVLLDRLEWHALAHRVRARHDKTRRETVRKLLLAKADFDARPLAFPTARALAQAHGFSEFHFSRAFHSVTGASPYAYMLDARLAEARRLLACPGMTVAEVGVACGFSDPATFARAFKRRFGEPPSMAGNRARIVKR